MSCKWLSHSYVQGGGGTEKWHVRGGSEGHVSGGGRLGSRAWLIPKMRGTGGTEGKTWGAFCSKSAEH